MSRSAEKERRTAVSLPDQDSRLDYSLRRYFVDEFHFRHVPLLSPGSRVLDLGGNRIRKRGQFNIEHYDLHVVYANLSVFKQPDVQADAACIPFQDNCFDTIICSELLEHVPDPQAVLREVHRVMRPAGHLLVCVPFLYRIHGDPDDYGRYTDFYWADVLHRIGFSPVQIERQGLFWSVLVDMLRDLTYQQFTKGRPASAWTRRRLTSIIGWCCKKAIAWDSREASIRDPWLSSYTTGFGIVATKAPQVAS